MTILRTPDARFDDLVDYPFVPNYVELEEEGTGESIRMHYVREGPVDGPVVLLLHGEPSWSYLYRHMIPPLAAAGCSVIAPDLVGFGRSDKLTGRSAYTYTKHVAWTASALFTHLGLEKVTLFCQDWGGLIGLRLVAEHRERFQAVLASNTALPDGTAPISQAFLDWLEFSQNAPDLDVGAILQLGSSRTLTERELEAYRAPFPDERFMAGVRSFPALVPIQLDQAGAADNRAAWSALQGFHAPFLTLFGAEDSVTLGSELRMIREIPGAKSQSHRIVDAAHHFIQEDASAELVSSLLELVGLGSGQDV